MLLQRLWVITLMVFMATSVFTASAVKAQSNSTTTDSVIENWTNPGSFPFTGNYSDTCELYANTLTSEQCARAIDQSERGLGAEMYLQDGDILEVSFTVGGVHQSKTLRVWFGTDVSTNDPKRRALVYDTGRTDGVKLVRPDICGNWSVMTIRPESQPVTQTSSIGQLGEMFGCWLEPNHHHTHGGSASFLPGVDVGGFCNDDHFIPGLFLEGDSIQSNGQGLVCGWYPIRH